MDEKQFDSFGQGKEPKESLKGANPRDSIILGLEKMESNKHDE